MSTVSVSYSSLKNAASEASSVAKKYSAYSDSLKKTVYNKLNSYDGTWTSSLSSAKSKISSKISYLEEQESKYSTYSADLLELRDECKQVDKSVKNTVSSLTADFKSAHGIRNSVVENSISNFFTSLKNGTALGRWINGVDDTIDAFSDYVKAYIKEWYDYGGGKDFLVDIGIAIAVLAISIAGVLTAGSLIALIAASVAFAIAAVNFVTTITLDAYALGITSSGSDDDGYDPATARRLASIDSFSDFIRSSFYYGIDGESYEYNSFNVFIADALDITDFVASTVTFVCDIGKLFKNTVTWLKGLSMSSFETFLSSFKSGGLSYVKKLGKTWGSNFIENLSKNYWDFSSMKGIGKALKNYSTISKTLLEDGINISSITEILTTFGKQGFTIFTVTIDDKSNNITINDFTKIYDKFKKLAGSEIFSEFTASELEEVLSGLGDLDISISAGSFSIPHISFS